MENDAPRRTSEPSSKVRMSIQEGLAQIGWENLVSALDAHAIIAVTDRRGVITYVNDKFCAISGYSREELIGKTHRMVNAGFHLPEFWQRFWETIKSGQIWSGAICNRAKKGHLYWVQTTIYPVKGKDGEIARYVALRTEMTQQKQAEALLRETEQRWQFALEGNGDGVWDWNVESGEVYYSNRWKELVGSGDEVVGNGFDELKSRIHPEDWPRWHACLNGPFDRPFEVEHRMKRSDGSYFWSVTRGKVVDWDEKGKPLRVIGTLRDESERKAVYERLQESESQFREAFENSRIGTAIVGLDGSFQKANEALCQMLGYTELELKSMSFQEVTHPEDLGKDKELSREILDGERLYYRLQKRYLTREGRTIWANLNVVIVRRADGSPRHFVSQVEDVTEAVRQREELARLAREAEEANRAKSDFLANMSHEIRTPMNGVIGMTSLLLDSKGLNSEQRRQAEIIRSSGQALLGVINDILDFSKVEAGQLRLENVDFDLRDLLDDLSFLIGQQARQKGLEYLCNIASDTPNFLKGDPGRLRQVLLNLLSNAVKFTNAGSVTLGVSLVSREAKRDYLRFAVRDTGIGIEEVARERLFGKFMQADSSTTRVYGGTGLGLAICKSLVQMMQGQIGVASELGNGSEFWFEVEMETASDGTLARMSKLLANRSVLLVTADEDLMENLEARLENWALDVGTCIRVSTAVQLLRERDDSGQVTNYVLYDSREGEDGLSMMANMIAVMGASKRPRIIVLGGERETGRQSPGVRRIGLRPRQSELFNALLEEEDGASLAQQSFRDLPLKKLKDRSCRVLVAEDNKVNQMVLLGMLEKFGLSADSVANGREVLEALKSFRYDLVLMDVQMPEMDGLVASRRIRSGEAGDGLRKIPVVGITAHARGEDREKCLAAGMTDYLAKPVAPDQLFAKLDAYLPYAIEVAARPPAEGEPDSEGGAASVFDEKRLLDDAMGDVTLARRVASTAMEEFAELDGEIRRQFQERDFESLKKTVHTLKGASLATGCYALSQAAKRLEKVANEASAEQFEAEQRDLSEAMACTIERLREYLKGDR